MSGAHRPTWTASIGGDGLKDGANSAPTFQYSSRDLPSHKKLKYRMDKKNENNKISEANKQIEPVNQIKDAEMDENESKEETIDQINLEETESINQIKDDIDADTDIEEEENEQNDQENDNHATLKDSKTEDSINKPIQDNTDFDDDTEELLRELERIKKEREAQKMAENHKKQIQLQTANPLMNLSRQDDSSPSSSLLLQSSKRKWTEETIFKNQAKGISSSSNSDEKRFINDTVRNDFHKKFMARYVR